MAEDDLRNGRIEFHTCDELGKESSDGDCFFITSNERSNTIFLNNEQSLFSIRYDKEGKKQINEVRGEVFETDEKYNCYYSSFTRREDGTFISDIFYCI